MAQHKNMKTILIAIFVLIFVFMVVLYPFKIKWYFHFNLLKNMGFVVFKVMFIKLLCEKIKINERLEFEAEGEKTKNKKNKKFFKEYVLLLAKKVDVKHLDLFCDVGVGDDAYFVSMLSGYINAIGSALFSVFLNKYKDIKICYNTIPYYQEEKLEFAGKIIVSFNLINVFVSLYLARKTTKKEV